MPFLVSVGLSATSAAIVHFLVKNDPSEAGERPAMTSAAMQIVAVDAASAAAEPAPPLSPAGLSRALSGLLPGQKAPATPAKPAGPPPHPLDGASSTEAIRAFFRSLTFVFLLLANFFVLALSYIEQYLAAWSTQALGASTRQASLVPGAYSIGAVVGLLFGGYLHDRLPSRGRSIAVAVYAVVQATLCCSLPLLFQADRASATPGSVFTVELMMCVLPFVGVSLGILTFIVANVYLCEFGGKSHATTAANVCDVFGIAGSALTQLVVGELIEDGRYVDVLWVVAMLSALTGIFFCAFAATTYSNGTPMPTRLSS